MTENKEIENLSELTEYLHRLKIKMTLLRLIIQAKSEYDRCDFKKGRKSLIEAYLIDKKNPVILRGLGCIKQFDRKYNSAIRYFKKALRYSEKKEIEYSLLGMVYYIQDKLDEAIKYFNLAIDLNENNEQIYDIRNNAMLKNHLKIVDLQENLKKME